ncbi:MAG: ferredoxin--NADP reductase [Kiloniellaceae bacterium]|nr:ferredoxin--NADP reductase [Kiloniellaceae bacterium]
MEVVEGPVLPKSVTEESVLAVHHWTDELFTLRVTRPASFRFRSGEFAMLGLMVEGRPLLRAYSMASPSWDDGLDFFSIKVPDGPLTSRLQHVAVGDRLLLGRKPTGTLVLDALTPGRRLFLLGTGTGMAPFASLIRDPETYERYDEVVLTHTCRNVADLGYGASMVDALGDDPLVGEIAPSKLTYYASATREDFIHRGRITDLIDSGRIFEDVGVEPLALESDRVMLCGSQDMLDDLSTLLEGHGFTEGNHSEPGHYVIEKAFVEK